MTSSKEERLRKVEMTDDDLREALSRPDELAQLPALIMANIEDVPNWIESVPLATAHAHAYVLHNDLPATLSKAAEYAEDIGRLRAGLEAAEKALQIIAWEGADSATSKQILAACRDTAREALALSTVVGGDSSSNEDHGSSRRCDDPIAGLAP